MKKLILITALFTFATGCVSKSKHEQEMGKLQQELQSSTKDRGQLKTSLEEMRKALAEMQKREDEQKKRLQEFNDLTQRFKKLIDAGTLSVRIIDGKMVVSLGSDVLFPSGSATLSAKGKQTIKDVTAQLAAIPDKNYQVEGHTDNTPFSPSNWELASSRALNVTKRMVAEGLPATRVSAASFGENHPAAPNDTNENRALNRRIEIVIVPDLSSLPGYEELQKYSEEQVKPVAPTKSATPAKKEIAAPKEAPAAKATPEKQ